MNKKTWFIAITLILITTAAFGSDQPIRGSAKVASR